MVITAESGPFAIQFVTRTGTLHSRLSDMKQDDAVLRSIRAEIRRAADAVEKIVALVEEPSNVGRAQ